MNTSSDPSVAALYQAPLADFVAERKRIAAELKAAGERDAAKALLERKKPTATAWAVNQLYWRMRPAWTRWMAAADRVRSGDLSALAEHKEQSSQLRRAAAQILESSGHPASDDALRRVSVTLSALAAEGRFDPDPPGALTTDREPSGFEGMNLPPREAALAPAPKGPSPAERAREAARLAAEAAAKAAAIAAAVAHLEDCVEEVAALERALEAAREAEREARARVAAL